MLWSLANWCSMASLCRHWPSAETFEVKTVGKPDAGNPHVGFDERGWERGDGQLVAHRARRRLWKLNRHDLLQVVREILQHNQVIPRVLLLWSFGQYQPGYSAAVRQRIKTPKYRPKTRDRFFRPEPLGDGGRTAYPSPIRCTSPAWAEMHFPVERR
jgi:hypothetical protein